MFDRKNTAVDALVVGAGLAGLSCAVHLQRAGRTVTVLEASNGVGGRVRSDIVDGFTLDRGFQVLLTAYPEARSILDYNALRLQKFSPGALVQLGDERAYIADPLCEPTAIIKTAKARVGSLLDKARVGRLQFEARKRTPEQCFDGPDVTTISYLRGKGFSEKMIDRFFRPFFGGVFLERELATSSRMFEFVFSMLAAGDNAIPSRGMGAIAEQLAEQLEPGTIQLGQRVVDVNAGRVTLLDQGELQAQNVIVATEGPQAARLLSGKNVNDTGSQPVSCLYFAAEEAPYPGRAILLNGTGPADGPINNMCVPSNLSRELAPTSKHLISVSVLGTHSSADENELEADVRRQLRSWFGEKTSGWDHLRTYNILHALPAQQPGVLSPPSRAVALGENLFVCGDHREQASINGALASGRKAAEAVLNA